MIIWLTGNSGTGKTTIGKLLAFRMKAVLLDGDIMRESISVGAGFDKASREEHNFRVARLAKVLDNQGFRVVVSVIAPYKSTREKIDKQISPIWIHLFRSSSAVIEDRPYELSKNYCLSFDIDNVSIERCYDTIMSFIGKIDIEQ